MLPGWSIPGKHAITQITESGKGHAAGQTIEIVTTLQPGQASGSEIAQRVAGVGPRYRKAPATVPGIALGEVIAVSFELRPGVASGRQFISPARVELSEPAAPVAGRAPNASLSVRWHLIAGKASGGGRAQGAVMIREDWTRYDNNIALLAA